MRLIFNHFPSPALILAPLSDLHSAFNSAKEDSQDSFIPKRTVSLETGKPNILAFACNDTRLFVALDQGQLLVYDTASLFSPGSNSVAPIHIQQDQSGPVRQISPNPGTEQNLSDFVAVVRSNASVTLYNTKLESLGGWVAEDTVSVPVAGICLSYSILARNTLNIILSSRVVSQG